MAAAVEHYQAAVVAVVAVAVYLDKDTMFPLLMIYLLDSVQVKNHILYQLVAVAAIVMVVLLVEVLEALEQILISHV